MSKKRKRVYVCAREWERVYEYMKGEKLREGECMCKCVCERERKRWRENVRKSETERMSVCV